MSKTSSVKKLDPFKTRKSKVPLAKADDAITPPQKIQKAIDAFREAQDQYKHFEGEMTIHKDQIMSYGWDEYSKRMMHGKKGSFKVLGEETMVTYVAMDSSAGLSDEDVALIEQRWGKEAAQQLIGPDFSTIRFDAAVLEANYDAVVEALQSLPESVFENLFKPMLRKAKSGAVDQCKKFAKNSEELKELLQDLKMKNYIR